MTTMTVPVTTLPKLGGRGVSLAAGAAERLPTPCNAAAVGPSTVTTTTARMSIRPCRQTYVSGRRAFAPRAGVNGFPSSQAQSSPITLHVGESSFTLPFSSEAAKGLNTAIDGLFQTFKEREKASRPQRWKTMEYKQTGNDGVYFEVFCNPNAYSNAFQAKVLITVKDDKLKISTEGQLSALKADVDEYVGQIV